LAAEPPEGLELALVPRREDKLVKVWLKSGGEAWTPVHVGVPGTEGECVSVSDVRVSLPDPGSIQSTGGESGGPG